MAISLVCYPGIKIAVALPLVLVKTIEKLYFSLVTADWPSQIIVELHITSKYGFNFYCGISHNFLIKLSIFEYLILLLKSEVSFH